MDKADRLRTEGLKFFRDLKQKHGELDVKVSWDKYLALGFYLTSFISNE